MLLPYLRKIQKKYAPSQLTAFFKWCNIHPDAQYQPIYVDYQALNFYCDYKHSFREPTRNIQFIITNPGQLAVCLYDVGIHNHTVWKQIFSTPDIEIWENTSLHDTKNLPLRFGLTIEEKVTLTRIVRTYLSYLLDQKSNIPNLAPTPLPERFLLPTDLDVALWINGELRGSIVIESTSLINGCKKAALLACSDARFKPVTIEELKQTAIEFNLISSLRLPVTEEELRRNYIYPEKTYRLKTKSDTGWYVPAVFNCITIQNLHDLFTSLSLEKINNFVPEAGYIFDISETESFIDIPATPLPYNLHGPIMDNVAKKPTQKLLHDMQQEAIQYLLRNQESDGNIIAILYPLQGRERKIDWIRLAYATYALITYGKHHIHSESKRVGRLAFNYLHKHLLKHQALDPYTQCLSSLYFYQTALALEEVEIATQAKKRILELLPKVPYEPILYLQLAKFTTLLPTTSTQDYSQIVWDDFLLKLNNKEPIDLAAYAGLLDAKCSKNNETCVQKTYEWYLTQQQANGSFPAQSHQPGLEYVRGTGKIVECLVTMPGYRESMSYQNSLLWLSRMQYNHTNSYFIKNHQRTRVLGGFRHDTTNSSAWIDACAHILLI